MMFWVGLFVGLIVGILLGLFLAGVVLEVKIQEWRDEFGEDGP